MRELSLICVILLICTGVSGSGTEQERKNQADIDQFRRSVLPSDSTLVWAVVMALNSGATTSTLVVYFPPRGGYDQGTQQVEWTQARTEKVRLIGIKTRYTGASGTQRFTAKLEYLLQKHAEVVNLSGVPRAKVYLTMDPMVGLRDKKNNLMCFVQCIKNPNEFNRGPDLGKELIFEDVADADLSYHYCSEKRDLYRDTMEQRRGRQYLPNPPRPIFTR